MRDSTYRYTPGRLTGDYIHEHEHEHGVTPPGEMTLKQKIRAQREKILREEAEAAGPTDGAGADGAERSRHQPDGVGVGACVATNTAKAKDGDGGEGLGEGWVLWNWTGFEVAYTGAQAGMSYKIYGHMYVWAS